MEAHEMENREEGERETGGKGEIEERERNADEEVAAASSIARGIEDAEEEDDDEDEDVEEEEKTGMKLSAAARKNARRKEKKKEKKRREEEQMKRKEEEQADKEGGEEKNEGQSGAEGEREEERARSKPEEGPSIESMLSKFPDITWDGACKFTLGNTFAPGMNVPASFYANKALLELVLLELKESEAKKGGGGFLPAVQQLANVATLPGIVGQSIGMPDIHSGYGFAIGNVAAMDLDDPDAVVSPGGVGFDINCGVRLLRTNLMAKDIIGVKEKLADQLFKCIPVGVGAGSILDKKLSAKELDAILDKGMEWAEQRGLCWPEDRLFVEEGGRFKGARASAVSPRAKERGKTQCGSLGSGNHYVEVQEVVEVFDPVAAEAMGLREGGVCVMLHSGSRGIGHQVCTDALEAAGRAMRGPGGVKLVDKQLACLKVNSPEGQGYLAGMQAAANYAFVNRTLLAKGARSAFASVFGLDPRVDLAMHTVYDVSHNIAKEELHTVAGREMRLLVHRKGATRAFAPGHADVPELYRRIGQPVLVGGSMGTCSYVLTGTVTAMENTFGSTCHGAGRALSRTAALRVLDSKQVLLDVAAMGCCARVATRKLAAEEAPQSYKDVSEVVDTCQAAGISRKCVRLKPLICVKG